MDLISVFQCTFWQKPTKDVIVENSSRPTNSIVPILDSISKDNESDYVSNSQMEMQLSKSEDNIQVYSMEDISSDLIPKSKEILEKSEDVNSNLKKSNFIGISIPISEKENLVHEPSISEGQSSSLTRNKELSQGRQKYLPSQAKKENAEKPGKKMQKDDNRQSHGLKQKYLPTSAFDIHLSSAGITLRFRDNCLARVTAGVALGGASGGAVVTCLSSAFVKAQESKAYFKRYQVKYKRRRVTLFCVEP
ncbi:hypothetical protein ACFE04_026460 [Oxalis oulophora]